MDIVLILRITAIAMASAVILMTVRELFFMYRLFGFRDSEVKPDDAFTRLLLTITAIPLIWLTDNLFFPCAATLLLAYTLWVTARLTASAVGIAYLRYLIAISTPDTNTLPPRPDLAGLPLFSFTEDSFRQALPSMNIFAEDEIARLLEISNACERVRRLNREDWQ